MKLFAEIEFARLALSKSVQDGRVKLFLPTACSTRKGASRSPGGPGVCTLPMDIHAAVEYTPNRLTAKPARDDVPSRRVPRSAAKTPMSAGDSLITMDRLPVTLNRQTAR